MGTKIKHVRSAKSAGRAKPMKLAPKHLKKAIGDVPPLPTDIIRTPRVFDAVVGREAFLQVEKSLRAISADSLLVVNTDLAAAAMAAFVGVDFMREPWRKELLDEVPEKFLAKHSDIELENLAWATWWLQTRSQSVSAAQNEVRVDPDLIVRGTDLRTRMLRVLGYYFDDDRGMQAELADIRSGTGYQDMAVDLTRLEGHYTVHAKVLAQDTKYYDPNDGVSARQVANGILAELRESAQAKDETIDLRNRAWTRLSQVYAAIKSASDFVFRHDAGSLAMLPTLRAVALSFTPRARSASVADPAPTPPVDAPPATSPVVVTPASPAQIAPASPPARVGTPIVVNGAEALNGHS